MTKIISLYAAAGAGKSTSAAYMFAQIKQKGANAELVAEYVKKWAWQGIQPGTYDQILFLGKQCKAESMLLNKVEYIVTDSPVWLSAFYAERYSPPLIRNGIESLVQGYYQQVATEGHRHIHLWLNRSKPYNPSGRFQTAEEAKAMDGELKVFLQKRGIPLVEVNSDFSSLDGFLEGLEL